MNYQLFSPTRDPYYLGGMNFTKFFSYPPFYCGDLYGMIKGSNLHTFNQTWMDNLLVEVALTGDRVPDFMQKTLKDESLAVQATHVGEILADSLHHFFTVKGQAMFKLQEAVEQ